MQSTLEKIRAKLSGKDIFTEEFAEDYVELSPQAAEKTSKGKVLIRSFVIEDFADIKPALDALREGYTITLINIRPLKEKDMVEVKRAVSKLKKTCDAIEGDIAGFGEDWLVVTPSFASVYRPPEVSEGQPQQQNPGTE